MATIKDAEQSNERIFPSRFRKIYNLLQGKLNETALGMLIAFLSADRDWPLTIATPKKHALRQFFHTGG